MIGMPSMNMYRKAKYSSIFVIVDNNTLQFCLPLFEEKINSEYKVIVTSSGESHKNIDSCKIIWDKMISLWR